MKRRLKKAKVEYRKKIERNLQNSNIREVWTGINTVSGYNKKKRQSIVGDVDRANEFNQYFYGLDNVAAPTSTAAPPFPPHVCISTAATTPPLTPVPPRPFVTETGVRLDLGRLCTGKASGSDGVCLRLLKDMLPNCMNLSRIFNLSPQFRQVLAL